MLTRNASSLGAERVDVERSADARSGWRKAHRRGIDVGNVGSGPASSRTQTRPAAVRLLRVSPCVVDVIGDLGGLTAHRLIARLGFAMRLRVLVEGLVAGV